MAEPGTSDKAQQDQDRAPSRPVALAPLANSTVPKADGAVHGGEAAKPGQMDGDDDSRPSGPGPAAQTGSAPRSGPKTG